MILFGMFHFSGGMVLIIVGVFLKEVNLRLFSVYLEGVLASVLQCIREKKEKGTDTFLPVLLISISRVPGFQTHTNIYFLL